MLFPRGGGRAARAQDLNAFPFMPADAQASGIAVMKKLGKDGRMVKEYLETAPQGEMQDIEQKARFLFCFVFVGFGSWVLGFLGFGILKTTGCLPCPLRLWQPINRIGKSPAPLRVTTLSISI